MIDIQVRYCYEIEPLNAIIGTAHQSQPLFDYLASSYKAFFKGQALTAASTNRTKRRHNLMLYYILYGLLFTSRVDG